MARRAEGATQFLRTYFILWLLAVLGKKKIVVVRIVASEGLDHCRPADSLRMSHFESENFFPKQTVLSFFHSLCLRVSSSCPCGSGQHRVWAVQAAMAAALVCAVLAGFLYFSGTGCDVPHEDFPGHVTA